MVEDYGCGSLLLNCEVFDFEQAVHIVKKEAQRAFYLCWEHQEDTVPAFNMDCVRTNEMVVARVTLEII